MLNNWTTSINIETEVEEYGNNYIETYIEDPTTKELITDPEGIKATTVEI